MKRTRNLVVGSTLLALLGTLGVAQQMLTQSAAAQAPGTAQGDGDSSSQARIARGDPFVVVQRARLVVEHDPLAGLFVEIDPIDLAAEEHRLAVDGQRGLSVGDPLFDEPNPPAFLRPLRLAAGECLEPQSQQSDLNCHRGKRRAE